MGSETELKKTLSNMALLVTEGRIMQDSRKEKTPA